MIPVTTTAAVVTSVPTHRLTVSLPIEPICRYSSAMLRTPTPIATAIVPARVRSGQT